MDEIRDETQLNHFRDLIADNPLHWMEDPMNPLAQGSQHTASLPPCN